MDDIRMPLELEQDLEKDSLLHAIRVVADSTISGGLPEGSLETVEQEVRKLLPQDVDRVLPKKLSPEKLTALVIGGLKFGNLVKDVIQALRKLP